MGGSEDNEEPVSAVMITYFFDQPNISLLMKAGYSHSITYVKVSLIDEHKTENLRKADTVWRAMRME